MIGIHDTLSRIKQQQTDIERVLTEIYSLRHQLAKTVDERDRAQSAVTVLDIRLNEVLGERCGAREERDDARIDLANATEVNTNLRHFELRVLKLLRSAARGRAYQDKDNGALAFLETVIEFYIKATPWLDGVKEPEPWKEPCACYACSQQRVFEDESKPTQ